MRVILQTAVAVIVSTIGFLVSPMFFPFLLIGAYCAIFGPVAVIAAFQKTTNSRSRREAAREVAVVAGNEGDTAPRPASRLPVQA